MNRIAFRWFVLVGALLAPAMSFVQVAFAQIACTRPGLEAATELYLAAQGKGDPSGMPLAMGLDYMENQQVVPIASGVIQKPMKIDHHRSLIDTATCQSFTEVIVTDKSHPYLIGTRLRVNKDKIVELESMVTQPGDWLFDADAYLKYSSSEDWGVIPAAKRDTRDTLVHAANAYLDAFLEKNLDPVPWGYPCNRTEGGRGHTGKGTATDSCQDGVPAGVNIVARRFIVDETIGSVVVFCTFGVNGAPDSHLFRLENGKLRFVHTLTHLSMADFNARRGGQGKAAPPPPASPHP